MLCRVISGLTANANVPNQLSSRNLRAINSRRSSVRPISDARRASIGHVALGYSRFKVAERAPLQRHTPPERAEHAI
jgi:hypothetical protein